MPAAKNARILLVPRKMISGDRTTLAVLDVNGRLTPGVTIAFSNGDHVTTDSTGRGLFVAPLTPGVLYATIQGTAGASANAGDCAAVEQERDADDAGAALCVTERSLRIARARILRGCGQEYGAGEWSSSAGAGIVVRIDDHAATGRTCRLGRRT